MNSLEQRVAYLEGVIAQLLKSDRYTVQKTVQIFDGRNMQLGNGTGTMIGTEAAQKLGFLGTAPIPRQASIALPTGGSTTDTQARVAIGTVISTIQAFGFIA